MPSENFVNWDVVAARASGNWSAVRQRVAKASGDIDTGDLQSQGGYLSEADADEFWEKAILQSKLVKMGTMAPMKSHTQNFPRVGFDSVISHRHGSGSSLPEAQRSKPDLGTVQIATDAFAAEVRMPDDVVEDAVSGEKFKQLVFRLAHQRIMADVEYYGIRSDTASPVYDLAGFDGILKQINVNTYDYVNTGMTRENLKKTLEQMPVVYKQDKSMLRFISSPNAVESYEDELQQLGIDPVWVYYHVDGPAPQPAGHKIPIEEIPLMPEDLGGGSNRTVVLLGDPKQLYWGFWRKVRVEFERVAREQVTIAVFSYRFGVAVVNPDAWVKGENVHPNP